MFKDGQANAPEETNTNEQEQAQSTASKSVIERLAERFQMQSETSEVETIEDGVENTNAVEAETDQNNEVESEQAEIEKFQILLDGVYTVGDKELSGQELQDGLLRREDYTKKTTEIAEKRKEYLEKENKLEEISNFYNAANVAALNKYASIDWVNLQSQDPAQYQELAGQYQALVQRQKQIEAIQEDFQNQVKARQERDFEKQKEEFNDKIKGYVSDFNHDTIEQDYAGLTEHYDISMEDVLNTLDPRFFALAKDALAFRNAKKNVAKIIEDKPTPSLPTRNKTQQKNTQNMSIAERLSQRLNGGN